ncbi:hypothetical protein B0T10DRAFT_571443 [Thelonectria olida]|uniref:Uncharacterized protein n=1 Tax=Thelonectria olida TaxID=1576542 RepID=A0A9P9AZZ4_9HYPO|nr:hypothetical protein B0T10DRAFT_571443 [Thelonectria olida]
MSEGKRVHLLDDTQLPRKRVRLLDDTQLSQFTPAELFAMSDESTVLLVQNPYKNDIGVCRRRQPICKPICKPEDLSQEEAHVLHDICVAFLESGGVGDADATAVAMVPLLLSRVFADWNSDLPLFLVPKIRDLAQGDRSMPVGSLTDDLPTQDQRMRHHLTRGRPVYISVYTNREQQRVHWRFHIRGHPVNTKHIKFEKHLTPETAKMVIALKHDEAERTRVLEHNRKVCVDLARRRVQTIANLEDSAQLALVQQAVPAQGFQQLNLCCDLVPLMLSHTSRSQQDMSGLARQRYWNIL